MKPQEYGYWIGFRRPSPDDIPDGWKLKRLEEVATFSAGGRLGLTMSDYADSGFDAYSAEGQNGKVGVAEFDGPAVIVSSIGARCGKCFYPRGKFTTLANVQVIFPDAKELDAGFLWNLVNDERFWPRYATAQPFIRPSDIKESWIPVPPPNEQGVIARILDAVDTALERTRAAVDRAREVKRAALHRFFYDALGETAYADRPRRKLPPGWSLVATELLLAEEPKNGVSPEASSQPPGTPTFSIAAIRNGRVDLNDKDNLKYVRVSETVARRFCVQRGDVLIVRGNANADLVGKAGMVNVHPEGCIYPDIAKRVVFRPDSEPKVISAFAVLAWNHAIVHNQVLRRAKTSNGTLKINNRDVKQIVMPVPPEKEQAQLVKIIESVDAQIDALTTVSVAQERLKRALAHDLLTGRVRVSREAKAAAS